MSLLRCHLIFVILTLFLLPLCDIRVSAAPSSSPPLTLEIKTLLNLTHELEHWVDTDKIPCQDFFGYVCGKSIEKSEMIMAQRLKIEQENFERLIASDINNDTLDVEIKLKYFYKSCKYARSVDDLKNTLMYRVSGGWPALDDSPSMIRKRQNMTWMDAIMAFHNAGVESFFRYRIEIKSNRRIVYLEPYESQRYTLRRFEQLVDDVMLRYQINNRRARLIALEILNFERSRRDIEKLQINDDAYEWNYADFKTSKLSSTLQIDWDQYFKTILGKTLKPNDGVSVMKFPKFEKMLELLQNTTITRLLNWMWIDYLMDKSVDDCQMLVQQYFRPVYLYVVDRVGLNKPNLVKMYDDIGKSYDELIATTKWVDEISKQNSKQFLNRIKHLTLNSDVLLNQEYLDLKVTDRNFYRNLEHCNKFLLKQRYRTEATPQPNLNEATKKYIKFTVNGLFGGEYFIYPLNYMLIGEYFAREMIASGSSLQIPGAWRGMDSDAKFEKFDNCITQQIFNNGTSSTFNYNLNNLVLKLLAQHQTLYAFGKWQQQNLQHSKTLKERLMAGKLRLSLKKLYFIGNLLNECQQNSISANNLQDFVNRYVMNSFQFTTAFGCQPKDNLYARNTCGVL